MENRTFNFEQGEVLLFDKPYTWTSFDLVRKVRNLVRTKKVGHAGTLDPLATGLLIVCTGRMTKQIDNYQGMKKTYTGTFVLGQTTPSFDLETELSAAVDISHLTETAIHEATAPFTGDLMQIPPVYSAVKVDGKRAYESARKGQDVVIAPKSVSIYVFSITEIRGHEIDFYVECSKGTYIRSLARDFGEYLGVGAHLSALRRTAIGDFDVANAMPLIEFEAFCKALRSSEA